ncbi:DNA cytosine methyltransferase [Saccharothrix sp. S26]|uniref:DNA cytosine methyltransferase n=1 Tax=Saccharothrix sp. S26 TaxID=2907215 RepID=UPI001F1EFA3C|nr:DNA cytosine methyltransferase [Saccharothrix sp. S26]MCE6993262.1 DNA cytosine methyltransferase [Saccharothrix sp. S26]
MTTLPHRTRVRSGRESVPALVAVTTTAAGAVRAATRQSSSGMRRPGPVVGSLCTGYGGLDLGVLAALGGGRVAWVADPDPHITQILAARMPGSPNLGDIRTIDWTTVEPVEVLTAGFPCQDISAAGKRAGIDKGERSGLWTDIMAAVRVLRPALFVVENVAALRWRNGGLHRVLGDLAEAGYDALWSSVRAADVGAAHRRERVFLLAWPRLLRDGRGGGDTSDADCARRLVQRHQWYRRAGRPVAVGPAPAVADADGLGREELHTPDTEWGSVAARRGSAAADPASLGHRNGRAQGWSGVSAAAVAAGAPAGGTGGVVADAARYGRDEGLPGAAGQQGRSDVALGGHPPARLAGRHPDRRDRSRRHLVAVPDPDGGPASRSVSAAVNWSVYEAAIRRWEAVLDRPAPHPTQPGNHGRPVLAPAFVEHLMGLPSGWVTGLSLPRTAQLRALGNGVVPQQAAHAVSLLLADLAALLHTDHHTEIRQERAAA